MQAGRLDKRVQILQKVETRDTTGDDLTDADNWTVLATVWAAVQPLQGRELLLAKQLQQDGTTRFRIRYRADVTTKNRMKYRGVTFDITDVQHVEYDDRETVIMTRELPYA